MLRSMLRSAMLFTLLTLPSVAMADRTYDLLNGTTTPGGWTLSGTITTDGTTGTIEAANILSWSWTITNGVSSFTAASTGAGDVTTPGLTATTAALVLPYAGSPTAELMNGPYIQLGNIEWHTDTYNGTPIWEAALEPEGSFNGTGTMYGYPYPPGGPYDPQPAAPGTFAVESPVVVPEPSTLCIVGIGAVCIYSMRHKRRAERGANSEA